MTPDYIHEVTKQENVIFVCFGKTGGDSLQRTITENDVVIDLTGRRPKK